MCWRHAPDQYGAIHFHEDDIYDCGWETDFTFTVPENLKSGVYAMRLTSGVLSDTIPFFVRPKPGQPTSRPSPIRSTRIMLAGLPTISIESERHRGGRVSGRLMITKTMASRLTTFTRMAAALAMRRACAP